MCDFYVTVLCITIVHKSSFEISQIRKKIISEAKCFKYRYDICIRFVLLLKQLRVNVIVKERLFMGRKLIVLAMAAIGLTLSTFSCSKGGDDANTGGERYLYVATGQCNSGQGITTLSSTLSSRMVAKFGLSTTKTGSIVFDLAGSYQGGFFEPETGAQALVDNNDKLLLLTENAVSPSLGRLIFQIPKNSPFNTTTYASDSNAFTQVAGHITRSMAMNSNSTLLFSKSVSVEKIGTNTLRIPKPGPAAFVDNPGAACAGSNTFVSAVAVMPPFTGEETGKIIYAHQGATAASNRLGIISQNGYAVVGDCLSSRQISTVVHANDTGLSGAIVAPNAVAGSSPTAMVYIPTPAGPNTGKLLVAYSAAVNTDMDNSANLTYAIVMYDIDEASAAAATISANATILYRSSDNIFGISAMAFDSSDNSLYVATASQPGTANQATQAYGYKIEKFTFNLANLGSSPILTLVRENNQPFIDRSSLTKCITSMTVGN